MSLRSLSFPFLSALFLLPSLCWVHAQESKPKAIPAATEQAKGEQAKGEQAWKELIIGKSLEGWEKTNFGGDGDVVVNGEGELVFDIGQPLTGVTYKKDFPKENFEIRWEANRLDGSDFFVGITFPVGDEHCSFICGGWGGGVVGISSIDGNDASENQTTQFKDIKNKHWYKFTAKVDSKTITVTMDGEQILQVPREGKSFSVRGEVRLNRPMGYCVFNSKVAVKNFQYRVLPKESKSN